MSRQWVTSVQDTNDVYIDPVISLSTQLGIYVLLRLRVQNRRTKWNFPLNFRTMRKLSELYSGIFQTQLSG